MSLRTEQSRFALMISDLIIFAYEQGYELTFGDSYRDPRSHGHQGNRIAYGRSVSAHKNRLAVDFNLFKAGIFLSRTEDHEELGLYWESLGGTWGGRWQDGNHYSLAYQGVK